MKPELKYASSHGILFTCVYLNLKLTMHTNLNRFPEIFSYKKNRDHFNKVRIIILTDIN